MAQRTTGDEESGLCATDETPRDSSGFGGSRGQENGGGTCTRLGPLQNCTRLGMEDGRLVDWEPLQLGQEEPNVTYSITIALTLVPTSVAFSFLAGVDPQVGLTGSWIVALVTSITGGRPGMIYCAAGAAAVVVRPIVNAYGTEYMFLSFLLSGIITVILRFLGVAKLIKLLPASCMIGFVNGLAIVVFLAQIETFHTDQGTTNGGSGHHTSFHVFKTTHWIKGTELVWMLANSALTVTVNMLVPKVTRFPAAFAAIVLSTVFEWGITRPAGFKTKTVSDVAMVHGGLPIPIWLDDNYNIPRLFNMETLRIVGPNSIVVTAVALIEVLLTVRLVDELTETEGNVRQEIVSLGVSNIIASILGGQGGHSDIGLTLINISSGGRLRISGVIAGMFTLIVILWGYRAINIIPMSGLVGVMTVVVYHIFDWPSLPLVIQSLLPKSLKSTMFSNNLNKISRMDALAVLVVTILTPFTNLATAIACGCLVVFLGYIWTSAESLKIYSYCQTGVQIDDPAVIKVYEIRGPMYFGSCDMFLKSFHQYTDPDLIELHFQQADIFDYSALQAINTLGERYNALKKRVRLRWVKSTSLKVLIEAKDLFTNVISVEMGSDFEKPGPFIGLNREACDEGVHNKIREDNIHFRTFLRRSSFDNADRMDEKNGLQRMWTTGDVVFHPPTNVENPKPSRSQSMDDVLISQSGSFCPYTGKKTDSHFCP